MKNQKLNTTLLDDKFYIWGNCFYYYFRRIEEQRNIIYCNEVYSSYLLKLVNNQLTI